MPPTEGVIKFERQHCQEPIAPGELCAAFDELQRWRGLLVERGLVGADPTRYEGLGFGNVSARVDDPDLGGEDAGEGFIITGSQTGAIERLGPEHYCLVDEVDVEANRLRSRGLLPPSSESLSHAQLYRAWPECRAVFHVHSPLIWRARQELALPCTPSEIEYGTPEMARGLADLIDALPDPDGAVLAMSGHEDGVLSIGRSPDGAGRALLALLDRVEA